MKRLLIHICFACLASLPVGLASLLAGCTSNPPQPSSLVVEGWIDAGGYPVVLIHKSLVLADAPDTVRSLEEIVEAQLIPFGKVVVSDGDDEVILTGRIDTAYLPPYTYSSFNMTGEVGRQYTVTVKYNDMYATATTTIPPIAHLDSLKVNMNPEIGTTVHGYMSDVPTDAYYALFMREHGQKQFQLCPLGVFSGQDATDGRIEIDIHSPQKDSANINYGKSYRYESDTTYQVKVARMDYPSYRFWKAYNDQMFTGGILFVPVYKNIPSNIVGGIGYFSGFGCSVYTFETKRDSTYHFHHEK